MRENSPSLEEQTKIEVDIDQIQRSCNALSEYLRTLSAEQARVLGGFDLFKTRLMKEVHSIFDHVAKMSVEFSVFKVQVAQTQANIITSQIVPISSHDHTTALRSLD